MAYIRTILCVGTPPDLRDSRQLVLRSAGYDASSMDAAKAIEVLHTKTFDIVVISVSVSEEERTHLRQVVPERTRILQLGDFTPPQKLLEMIQLQEAS